MIEFHVTYWESGPYAGMTEVAAIFSQGQVEITSTDVARFDAARWDATRQYVLEHGHSDWATAYGGTGLREHLASERISAETMMAFGALHVLVPALAGVKALESAPHTIPPEYDNEILSDAIDKDNVVRIIGSITPEERDAAAELMQHGQLQKLSVLVTPAKGLPFEYVGYFMPFHVPGIATNDLSGAAHALKRRIPDW
jgi:hypothetical protein